MEVRYWNERWISTSAGGGRVHIIERVPVGVCQQCGRKFLTAGVSEELDRSVKSARIDRIVEVPVKIFQKAVA